MYEQELTIDPSVIRCIADPENIYDLKTYKNNIQNKKIILDGSAQETSILFNNYKDIFDSLGYDAKKRVDAVLNKHITIADKIEFVDAGKAEDAFAAVVTKTKSRIGNSESIVHKLLSHKNCEILGIDEFCNPPNNSRIVNSPRKILLLKDDEFRIQDVLKHYFENVTEIKIIDQYFLTERSFKNYKLVINSCAKLKRLDIYTPIVDEGRDFQNLKKEFPKIMVSTVNKKYHDRKIILDNYYCITLSSGLDFVDNEFKVWRDSVDIRIDQLEIIQANL